MEIVSGIISKLKSKYGEECRYCLDEAAEETRPYFYIKALPMEIIPLLGRRKKVTYIFDIHYFPLGGSEEMLEIAEALSEEMEYIRLAGDDIIRGSLMKGEILDNVLHFQVKYSVFLNGQQAKPLMEEQGFQIRVKK